MQYRIDSAVVKKRLKKLLHISTGIPPFEVIRLLMEADSNPEINADSKLELLRQQYSPDKFA